MGMEGVVEVFVCVEGVFVCLGVVEEVLGKCVSVGEGLWKCLWEFGKCVSVWEWLWEMLLGLK